MPEDPTGSAQSNAEPSRSELSEFENAGIDSTPEPQGRLEPSADITAPKPAATETAPIAAELSQKPTATATPERKFKVRGTEYAAAELLAKPELLEALVAQAERYPSVNEKYQTLLEKLAKGPEVKAEPAKPAPGPTAAEYQAAFGAYVQDVAKSGLIEEDFVAAYPNYANQGAALFHNVQQLNTQVKAVNDFLLALGEGNRRTSVVQNLNAITDSLANSGEDIFKPLADVAAGGEREKFYDFLVNRVNPMVESLNPEFLAAQWFAYKQKELAGTLKQVQTADHATAETRRRQAAGQPPAPRAPQGAMSDLERELRAFEATG